MSVKHPIISVTGSSGAGTTTVKSTFERIFSKSNSGDSTPTMTSPSAE